MEYLWDTLDNIQETLNQKVSKEFLAASCHYCNDTGLVIVHNPSPDIRHVEEPCPHLAGMQFVAIKKELPLSVVKQDTEQPLITQPSIPPALQLPRAMGKNITVMGNRKLGQGILQTSLPAGFSCKIKSSWCSKNCFGFKGNYKRNEKVTNTMYQQNLALLQQRPDEYETRVNGEIRDAFPKGGHGGDFRIHPVGDMISPEHVQMWGRIADKNPHVTFYAYTRTHQDPEMVPHLKELHDKPNVKLWLSTDKTMPPLSDDLKSKFSLEAKTFDTPADLRAEGGYIHCPEQVCKSCGEGKKAADETGRVHPQVKSDGTFKITRPEQHKFEPKQHNCGSCRLCMRAKPGTKLGFTESQDTYQLDDEQEK